MIKFTATFCFILFFRTISFAQQNKVVSKEPLAVKVSNQETSQEQVKQDKKSVDQQTKIDQPQIKQVPKAKRQIKPMAIKPKVKVKPIKIIKPKIKRP